MIQHARQDLGDEDEASAVFWSSADGLQVRLGPQRDTFLVQAPDGRGHLVSTRFGRLSCTCSPAGGRRLCRHAALVLQQWELLEAAGSSRPTPQPRPRAQPQRRRGSAAANAGPLTPREHQVLALLLEGRPPLQLGVELQVSRAVVKSTLAALRQKLGADNDVQLGAIAIQRGLNQPQMAAPPITAAVAEVAGEELPAATPRFASGADRQAIEARIQALIQQIGHTRPGLSHRREQLLTELYALRRSLHPAGARS